MKRKIHWSEYKEPVFGAPRRSSPRSKTAHAIGGGVIVIVNWKFTRACATLAQSYL